MALPRSATRVLIVEDDASAREMYRQALIGAGYSVTAVEDGIDALRAIDRQPPHVVVLDLMLPRVAGEDVYQELRANPATRTIPVVIVTGVDAPHLEPAALHHLLHKPVTVKALVAAVASAADDR